MKKMLFFVSGSLEHGIYSGFLLGHITKSGRKILHSKRRLHLINPFNYHLIGNSLCHTLKK